MGYTVLERCLQPDRGRRRAARGGGVSMTPVLHERKVGADTDPVLVTNARGVLMPTKASSSALLRCGLFPCEPDDEDKLFVGLYQTLRITSHAQGWQNRCATIADAVARMRKEQLEPKTVVVSEAVVRKLKIDPKEARRIQGVQGYVTTHQGLQALIADLPESSALVVAAPAQAGVHVRVDDHVGIMLMRVNRAFMLVEDGMAG